MHRIRILCSAIALLCATSVARGQVYERIDVDDQGQPGDVQGEAWGDISDEGRYVAFVSSATSFGGIDVSGTPDVFLRDRVLATTIRVTSTLSPIGAERIQQVVRVSGDGSVITFMRGQVPLLRAFVYVRATGVATEVLLPNIDSIRIDDLDQTGVHAAIIARNLSGSTDAYRLNLLTGGLVLCSRDFSGLPAGAIRAAIDDDGTHVAFMSTSPALVPEDTNAKADAFVFDIPGGVMLRASVSTTGVQGNGDVESISISGDGRFVALTSNSTNLVFGDLNGFSDAFVRDLRLGVTSVVSLTSFQAPMEWPAGSVIISGDGKSVGFISGAPTPSAPFDTTVDPFVKDLTSGALLEAGIPSPYAPEGVYLLGLSRDGRDVLIGSQPITPPTTSPLKGIFVVKFGPRCSTARYCTALPNSTGLAAKIATQGDASRALNNLVIAALGMPGDAIAMLVSGTSAVNPGATFGNGLLCIGGSLIRHGIHVADGGVILDAQDLHSAEYAGVNPGDTRYYQVYYRDPAAGGANFNTTDAVAVTFCW
ncbi:MAG: hypothetical protein JNL28_00615 [Planctomycetes bacterium]|nr:hypothetical protein [Planctomycetota bacterium]